jgi:A/G-specific adenine glycosylase
MNTEDLRQWFLKNKRQFPWRVSPSPYTVWISEVMLQQTQAVRVVDYFTRWMQQFPTIFDLARASRQEVLKCWEGLGYYSRAVALHAAASDIVERFHGKIPDTKEALRSIKGLGPYTTGAILSFAYHKKEAAVDANVMRVLLRYFAIEDDMCKAKTKDTVYDIATRLLPEKFPWEITEALIELGALVCQKTPKCSICPLKEGCQGYRQGKQAVIPVKSAKVQYQNLFREVAVIISEQGRYLVRRGKAGMPCAGLYEFAYFECAEGGLAPDEAMTKVLEELNLSIAFESYLEEEKHSFTRYRVTLYPKLYVANENEVPDFRWCNQEEAEMLAFSSGHKRILQGLLQNS